MTGPLRQKDTAHEEALRELAPSGEIRVALNLGNTATVRMDQNGRPTGPAPDFAKKLARYMGLPLRFVPYASAGSIMAADGDSAAWDIAFLAVDPARTDRFRFTTPYLTLEAAIAVRADGVLQDLDATGLRALSIGSVKGAAYDGPLRRFLPGARIVCFASPGAAIAAFLDGDIEALAGVRQSLEVALSYRDDIRLLGQPFAVIAYAVAVGASRAKAAELLDEVVRSSKESRG
jgi:polar amino acid transport system substrate-binding protein